MNRIKLFSIALISAGCLLQSCNDYLTVYPKTDVIKEDLFSSESGFKDALIGVYLQLKGDRLYGESLTMSDIEHLASTWETAAGSDQQKMNNFNYLDQGVENILSTTFGAAYNTIALTNSILEQIELQKHVFVTPGMYEILKGESLAVRAYCHLDLIRLYGPSPKEVSGANQLPYVRTLSLKPHARLTFEAYGEMLIQDVKEAETLLAEGEQKARASGDSFYLNRNTRMNYRAVKALAARAYLWFNQETEAFKQASALIADENSNSSFQVRLWQSKDITTDFNLSCEQFFGINNQFLPIKYSERFASGLFRRGAHDGFIRVYLFENNTADNRFKNWEVITLENGSRAFTTKKYKATNNLIPMLRLSEMYLVAMETAPSIDDAKSYWQTYKESRNAIGELPTDKKLREDFLLKEYRKEFIAEGQTFYAYKRMGAPKEKILPVAPSVSPIYTPPMPRKENQEF